MPIDMTPSASASTRLRLLAVTITVLRWQLAVAAALLVWWLILIIGEAAGWAIEDGMVSLGVLLILLATFLGIGAGVIAWRARFTWAVVHGFAVTPVAGLAVLNMLLNWRIPIPQDDVAALAFSVVLAVSVFVATMRGPHVRPRGDDRLLALAEAVRVCLLKHESFRAGHRILDRLVRLLSAPVVYAMLAGAFFTVLTFIRPRRPFEPVVAVVVLVGFWYLWTHLLDRLDKPAIRLTAESSSERSLIARLESGQPYGVYLRPFGAEGISAVLRDWPDLPFYAIDETRPDSPVLSLPEIWVPTARWRDLVFPLIAHADVCVVTLPRSSRLEAHRGLLAELDHAVRNDLQSRFVLVTPVGGRGGEGEGWSADKAARTVTTLVDRFPHQVLYGDWTGLRQRIDALRLIPATSAARNPDA
jgi:hypothetical protein